MKLIIECVAGALTGVILGNLAFIVIKKVMEKNNG